MDSLPHTLNRPVARSRDDLENVRELSRHLPADKTGPGQDAVNRSRPVQLAPKIDQDKIARPDNTTIGPGNRAVMRITAMRADRTDRRMICHEATLLKVFEDTSLYGRFTHRAFLLRLSGDKREGDV